MMPFQPLQGDAVMGAPVVDPNLIQPYQFQPPQGYDPMNPFGKDPQSRGYTLYDPSSSAAKDSNQEIDDFQAKLDNLKKL